MILEEAEENDKKKRTKEKTEENERLENEQTRELSRAIVTSVAGSRSIRPFVSSSIRYGSDLTTARG